MALITHLFLHEGWVHVLTNVWVLLLFGGAIELKLGQIAIHRVFYCGWHALRRWPRADLF